MSIAEIRFPDEPLPPVILGMRPQVIGRGRGCDTVLEHRAISRRRIRYCYGSGSGA